MENIVIKQAISKLPTLLIFIISLLFFNLVLATFLGDISFSFLVPSISFKGLHNFLAYLGYSDISLYLGLNSLFIGLFFYFTFSSIFSIIFGVILAIFFCFNNSLYSNHSNKEKIELYNFLIENNINSHRICERNKGALLFANMYKEHPTLDVCQKEILSFIYNDKMIQEYFNFVIHPNQFIHEGNTTRSFYVDNGSLDEALKSTCQEDCSVYRKKNYNDLLTYLSSNLSHDNLEQFTQWNTFNQQLLKQFSSIKMDIQKDEVYYLLNNVKTSEGIFQLHVKMYTENSKTLEQNVFLEQSLTDENIHDYKGYYFLSNEFIFIPITAEKYKSITEQLKSIKQLNANYYNKKLK